MEEITGAQNFSFALFQTKGFFVSFPTAQNVRIAFSRPPRRHWGCPFVRKINLYGYERISSG